MRVLADCPVDVGSVPVDKRVQWPGPAVGAWLAWLGPPVPAVAYKWADGQDEYERLKRQADAK